MKKLKLSLLAGLAFAASSINAQQWVQKMHDPNVSFYDVQQEFNTYWQNRPYEKGKGFKQFKRWEWFMEPRVYPSGNKAVISQTWDNYQTYINQNTQARNVYNGVNVPQSSTWTAVGPNGVSSGGGAGRLNIVRFVPGNANTMFTGGPASGLWKSTTGGTGWTTNTNNLGVLGVSDIAIDPVNTNNMYLATGDGDANDTWSIGILKSTDGGTTWNTTGLSYNVNQNRLVRRILINSTNPQILIAGTSVGILRSTDGGATWAATSITASIRDMEYKPGDPNTVYASGTRFYKSTDGGATWTTIATGLPANTAIDRLAIAVTAADPTIIYAVAGNATDNGFYGLYKSTNSGTSFTQVTVSSPTNLLGWSNAGTDAGGQSWYDLAIAASPTNASEVVVGGVNVWRSTNGGTSFTLYGYWTGSPYIHADIHDLIYDASGALWGCCDGGIFKRAAGATSWTDLSNPMNIAQPYRIGLSGSNANLMITGHQDNGTNRYNGTAWSSVMGGDGMDCFIDRTNNNVMYGEQYNGSLNRSTNGGASWTAITTGLTGTGAWMTPWHQDPSVANTIYVGYQQLFKSTNQGTNWTQTTGTMTGTSTIVEFAIAPSNNQVIYVIKGNVLFKTTNGGGAWTNITGTLPTASAQMTNLVIDPTDPTNVWVTFSGYSAANKIFVTTNGGTSWTNISTGLPNLPVNCGVYQANTQDGIYVGCDVGVYYRDNTTGNWAAYNTSLPNVPISDLEIYTPTLKLRAATYGRGVWEVDAINPGNLAPVAAFTSNRQVVCPGNTVTFTDQSSFTPTSWAWTFAGGTPATSTLQNPTVTYSTAGVYQAQLIATNANGSNTVTQTNYITVTGVNALPLQEGFVNATFPPTNWTTKDINNDGLFWARSTTVGNGSTNSMWFDNYSLDAAGTRDEMQTPKYNFTGFTSATLTFDVAYGAYDATYSDSLAVLISTDCGATFTQLYLKGGATLATTAGSFTTAQYTPTSAADWRNESISLNSYVGQGNVMIVFQNRGRYGQALFVDNINITGVTAGAVPTASFTSVATKCATQSIALTDASTNNPISWSWTLPGATPATSTVQNPTVTYAAAGTYSVTLVSTNANGSSTPYNATITVNPLPSVTSSNTGPYCPTNTITLSSSGATTYSWTGPAGFNNATQNPTRANAVVAMSGNYIVTGTDANGCVNTSTTAVVVNARPTATVTGTLNFCSGTNTVLSAATSTAGSGTITGYQWTLGAANIAGATNNTLTATAAGTYACVVTNSNGCSTTSANKVVVVDPIPAIISSGAVITPSTCGNANGAISGITASGGTGLTYTWSNSTPTVVGTSTTTADISNLSGGAYTLNVTNSNNCSSTSGPHTISSLVGPSAPTATSNQTILCEGDALDLDATSVSGAVSYAWAGPNGYVSSVQNPSAFNVVLADAGTYNVTATDANNCVSTSGTISIVVNAAPVVPTISVNFNVLTSSAATGNQWYLNGALIPGETSQTITVTQNGDYTVVVTGANNCTTTSAIETFSTVGLNDLSAQASITVNPNPSNGVFAISINSTVKGDYTLKITNAIGETITSKKLNIGIGGFIENIDLSNVSKGVYFIQLSNNQNKSVNKRIVIQ